MFTQLLIFPSLYMMIPLDLLKDLFSASAHWLTASKCNQIAQSTSQEKLEFLKSSVFVYSNFQIYITLTKLIEYTQ